MKTKLYVFASVLLSIMLAACEKDGDSGKNKTGQTAEQIVGTWVYDAPDEGIWEQQEFLSNTKLYMSADYLTPYMRLERLSGSYMVKSDNQIMLTYSNIQGGTSYQDVTLDKISRYEYQGRYYSDDQFTGSYTYHRLVGKLKMSLGEEMTLNARQYIDDAEATGMGIVDPTIAKISTSGTITPLGSGITYVTLDTNLGQAYVELIVTDLDNLFPDYSETLYMTKDEVIAKWPRCNREYDNAFLYPVRANDYADLVTILWDETDHIDYIKYDLRYGIMNESELQQKVNQYLGTKFQFVAEEDGKYYYLVDGLHEDKTYPYAVYNPKEHKVEMAKALYTVDDLWDDYTKGFGLNSDQLKSMYGAANTFYETGTMLAFLQENDYIQFISFSMENDIAYAVSVFLSESADGQTVLNYLNAKYYYYEQGSNPDEMSWAFTNKSTPAESTVGILMNAKDTRYITYVDLTKNRSVSTAQWHRSIDCRSHIQNLKSLHIGK